MAGQTEIEVAVSEDADSVAMRISGPCKMGICKTLKNFLEQPQTSGRKDLYLDLSNANAIDSTFTGFLLSLAKRSNGGDAGLNLHLVNPSERALEVLKTMHILSLFDVQAAMPDMALAWNPLVADTTSADEIADLVISTHEQLVDADERNAAEFGKVIDVFKAGRDKKKS